MNDNTNTIVTCACTHSSHANEQCSRPATSTVAADSGERVSCGTCIRCEH